MPDEIEISDSLLEVVHAAVERAFGWLQEDESLLGFAVVDSSTVVGMPVGSGTSGRALVTPLILAQDDGPFREFVTEHRNDIAAYAIVFDGIVRRPDSAEPTAAVRVEAGERGASNGFVFLETYEKESAETPPRRSGRLGVVQIVDNLLGGRDDVARADAGRG